MCFEDGLWLDARLKEAGEKPIAIANTTNATGIVIYYGLETGNYTIVEYVQRSDDPTKDFGCVLGDGEAIMFRDDIFEKPVDIRNSI